MLPKRKKNGIINSYQQYRNACDNLDTKLYEYYHPNYTKVNNLLKVSIELKRIFAQHGRNMILSCFLNFL
jgi:hypothetical protein